MRTVRAVLIVAAVAGCSGLPKDGRDQTGGGGGASFQAEVWKGLMECST